jgi:hypothetical protein
MSNDENIPVLTDAVEIKSATTIAAPILDEFQIDELRKSLTDSAYRLMERQIYSSIREMENTLQEVLTKQLGDELPELIDRILQEHLNAAEKRSKESEKT